MPSDFAMSTTELEDFLSRTVKDHHGGHGVNPVQCSAQRSITDNHRDIRMDHVDKTFEPGPAKSSIQFTAIMLTPLPFWAM